MPTTLCVSNKIVRRVASGPREKYVVQWYGHSKVYDIAQLSHYIPW